VACSAGTRPKTSLVSALKGDAPRGSRSAVGITLLPARLAGLVLTAFGLLGLVLAAIGIYGVISVQCGAAHARDRHPHGSWRLAPPGWRRAMRQGLVLVAMGAALGLGADWGVWRLVRGMLHGATAPDLLTFTVVPILLTAAAARAIWVPARRAAGIDPVTALKLE
jgi:putative ABC transport system permease protein